MLSPSKVESLLWDDTVFYIKRDDLLDPYLSGNKLRKLWYFLEQKTLSFKQIVSYGGLQSNAMLSMARLAYLKKLPFFYHVRYQSNIDLSIQSNFSLAQELGMQLCVTEADNDESLGKIIQSLYEKDTLIIPQGGATVEARYGVEHLAREISAWKEAQALKKLIVVTPSGTGTTALWLRNSLDSDIEVFTTAVVGDRSYLEKQMLRLAPKAELPQILQTKISYPFAKPNIDLWKLYQIFLHKGIELDLIYAPVMLKALEDNRELWEGVPLLYVHSGGVLGNTSQKARYKKLVSI